MNSIRESKFKVKYQHRSHKNHDYAYFVCIGYPHIFKLICAFYRSILVAITRLINLKLKKNFVNKFLIERALIQRYKKITPTTEQRANTRALQIKVTRAFEALLDTPLARSGTLPLHSYSEVGSFAKRTIMFPNLTADCVVIMRVRPTREAAKRLAEHFLIQYNRLNSIQLYRYDEERKENVYLTDEITSRPLDVEFNEDGTFEVSDETGNVRILVGCLKKNLAAGVESALHIPRPQVMAANAAVEHVKWFNDMVTGNKVRILTVLIKDLCLRFEAFSEVLNPRIIELMAFHW